MNKPRLEDKVVVMTGGGGLLGAEWKRAFEAEGAKVHVWDVKGENPVDVTKQESVQSALDRVLEESKAVDVLINAAALNPIPGDPKCAKMFEAAEDYDIDLWRKELDVGLTGTMICIQAVAPVMSAQLSGSIINVGSHYGIVAPDNRIYPSGQFKSIAYAVSKGSLSQLTRVWAVGLGPSNVRINCLALGGVLAGQSQDFVEKYVERTPMRRMATVSEYNGMLILLASDEAVYLTGQTIVMDGGWTAL